MDKKKIIEEISSKHTDGVMRNAAKLALEMMKDETGVIGSHITDISDDGLNEFKRECFSCYASCKGEIGLVEIGVDGVGNYAVRINKEIATRTQISRLAISFYIQKIS